MLLIMTLAGCGVFRGIFLVLRGGREFCWWVRRSLAGGKEGKLVVYA
jgi:hypothetical protein